MTVSVNDDGMLDSVLGARTWILSNMNCPTFYATVFPTTYCPTTHYPTTYATVIGSDSRTAAVVSPT